MRIILDKYRKPILAVFGVLLMVVFMLPANIRPGGDRQNPVIGHIGKEAVHASDKSLADHDWELVSRGIIVMLGVPPQQRQIPIAAMLLGPQAYQEINAHRESYLLLLKEAELRGVPVLQADVNDLLNRPEVGVADRRAGRLVAYSDLADMDEADAVRGAVGRLLQVRNAYQLAEDTVKVSLPLRRQLIARQFQTVNLAVVDVPASQFTAAAPTTQALEAQFKKYADVNPDDADKGPYGYGYRFPDRVKLQAIALPVASVRATAERARTKDAAAQYEWDRDAYKYYMANQSEFPTTAPAATTGPSAKAAGPTTRPFAEAKNDARQAVLENDVAKLTQRILDRLTNQITQDYVAYRSALNSGGKAPTSSVGVPYNSYDYLQRLAAEAQKNFGVLPTVTAYDKDFLSARDLINLPGLGTTYVDNQPFAGYVLTHAAPLTTEKDDTKTLQLFEPSPTVKDDLGNAYVFRLSDAQAAHAPASLQEVQAAVEQDVRAASTFEQAKKVADQLVAQAKQSGSLQSAANAAGRNLTTLTGVRFNDTAALLPLHLSGPQAQRSVLRQVFELMSSATKENPRPIGVIELPRDGRALVAQVTDVHSDLTEEDLRILEAQAGRQATQQFAMPLQADWYNYDSIVARVNFQPTERSEQNSPAAPDSTPPANRPLL